MKDPHTTYNFKASGCEKDLARISILKCICIGEHLLRAGSVVANSHSNTFSMTAARMKIVVLK